jgi:hypothetical protein
MLPNAKFVGIESLAFDTAELSHLQRTRSESAPAVHEQQADPHEPLRNLPQFDGKTPRALVAARRVFKTVRMAAQVAREAEAIAPAAGGFKS